LKYFILAGEASGDKQAALLCKALKFHDPSAKMIGWGGEAMADTGVTITRHYRELAFMGFVEVIRHLPQIMRNFKTCRREILTFQPDALILVDYPGFNLRMAKWAQRQGIRVYYYISPQLWAWHTSRVHDIKRAVRRMYVILPFEKAFYAQYGMEVMYIGHPLAKAVSSRSEWKWEPEQKHIALLPGSRKNEIGLILPEMARLAERMPDHVFHVAAVPHIPGALYEKWISHLRNVHLVTDGMEGVLRKAEVAVVTSGTATLETALYGVPQVVVYKGNQISFQIARRLIRVKYISLVNLIADKPLIPELIQHDCTAAQIQMTLTEIRQPDRYTEIVDGYRQIRKQLLEGSGPEEAARDIIGDVQTTHVLGEVY